MKKKQFMDELEFEQETKYNYILPRCTVCLYHTKLTDDHDKVLHFCEFYGGSLTMPETLDQCEEEGSFKEVM